jgi:hypothetical protein
VTARRARVLDIVGIAVLAATVAAALALVPRAEWSRAVEPAMQAVYGFFLALIAIALARAGGRPRLEQTLLALLLAAMPIVYLRGALATHRGALVWVEAGGTVLFACAAAAGSRHPRLLAAGIVAHGLAWDVWHLGLAVVPDWYAAACALVDLGLATYTASRLYAWSTSASSYPGAP